MRTEYLSAVSEAVAASLIGLEVGIVGLWDGLDLEFMDLFCLYDIITAADLNVTAMGRTCREAFESADNVELVFSRSALGFSFSPATSTT